MSLAATRMLQRGSWKARNAISYEITRNGFLRIQTVNSQFAVNVLEICRNKCEIFNMYDL